MIKRNCFLEAFKQLFNNHTQNILRLYDGWTNFLFTTSEVKRDN